MTKLPRILLIVLYLILPGHAQAGEHDRPRLPDWQILEFVEQTAWATARSRLEILPVLEDNNRWELIVLSSVLSNSEEVHVIFDPDCGGALTLSRLSQGKDQRLKSFEYKTDYLMRERRDPGANSEEPPEQWPVTYRKKIPYPAAADDTVMTSPYLLLLLAQRLQTLGPDKSLDVLVHTDVNFYRVRLTSGNGIPIDVDYDITGAEHVQGKRETLAVALQVSPAGTLAEKNDFSLLGLQGEIIVFFDRTSGLPLQVRGIAPRIGATEINLKSVTMRDAEQ